VYLITLSGSVWRHIAYVKAENADAYDELGCSMALRVVGRYIASGARSEGSAAMGFNGDQ
jgi:hypothetical protein